MRIFVMFWKIGSEVLSSQSSKVTHLNVIIFLIERNYSFCTVCYLISQCFLFVLNMYFS